MYSQRVVCTTINKSTGTTVVLLLYREGKHGMGKLILCSGNASRNGRKQNSYRTMRKMKGRCRAICLVELQDPSSTTLDTPYMIQLLMLSAPSVAVRVKYLN